ncbi:MAG: M28 family peptidase [Saprospiraceae bacterium]
MKIKTTFLCFFWTTLLFAQNEVPQISNLTLTPIDGNKLSITYDLSDAENDEVVVNVVISDNGGENFRMDIDNLTGDVNELQAVGNGKEIIWDYSDLGELTDEYTIKLVADDLQEVDIQAIVDQVDSVRLRSDLVSIEGTRHRNQGLEKLLETRDLIQSTFSESGMQVANQAVPFGNFMGDNVIGTQLGTANDSEIYTTITHYDGVTNCPAADDNGSGTVGLMMAARILSQYNFKKSLRFIAFDLEEVGLVGSERYVNLGIPAGDNIAGVLNLEMIGYYTERPNTQSFPQGFNLLYPDQFAQVADNDFKGDFLANIGKVQQDDWSLAFTDAAALYVPDLKVITFKAPSNWSSIAPDLGRSDHAPFWIANIPAVMLTNTSEFRTPHYHAPSDSVGTLNFTFMSNVVKATVATLAEQAEIQHSSIATATIDLQATPTLEWNPCWKAVFPNPVKQTLHLSTTDCTEGLAYAKIFALDGRLIFNQKQANNVSNWTLDVSDLTTGVYWLETNLGRQKIIKL